MVDIAVVAILMVAFVRLDNIASIDLVNLVIILLTVRVISDRFDLQAI